MAFSLNKQSIITVFAPTFYPIKGLLERLGSLDTSVSYQTDSLSGTYGRINHHNQQPLGFGQNAVPGVYNGGMNNRSDSFWALTRARSKTHPIESHYISLLKIGPNLVTNVLVKERAFFQILEERAQTGCVLSNNNELVYVCNKKMRAELEVGFSMFGYILTSIIGAVVALFCLANLGQSLIEVKPQNSLLILIGLALSLFFMFAGYASGVEGRKRYNDAVAIARS